MNTTASAASAPTLLAVTAGTGTASAPPGSGPAERAASSESAFADLVAQLTEAVQGEAEAAGERAPAGERDSESDGGDAHEGEVNSGEVGSGEVNRAEAGAAEPNPGALLGARVLDGTWLPSVAATPAHDRAFRHGLRGLARAEIDGVTFVVPRGWAAKETPALSNPVGTHVGAPMAISSSPAGPDLDGALPPTGNLPIEVPAAVTATPTSDPAALEPPTVGQEKQRRGTLIAPATSSDASVIAAATSGHAARTGRATLRDLLALEGGDPGLPAPSAMPDRRLATREAGPGVTVAGAPAEPSAPVASRSRPGSTGAATSGAGAPGLDASGTGVSDNLAAPGAPMASAGGRLDGSGEAGSAPLDGPRHQIMSVLRPLRRFADGTHSLAIQLRPEELGTVHVELTLDRGVISLHLTSDSPAAREVLSRSLDELRRDIEASGVRCGSFDVSDQPRRQDQQLVPTRSDQRSTWDDGSLEHDRGEPERERRDAPARAPHATVPSDRLDTWA